MHPYDFTFDKMMDDQVVRVDDQEYTCTITRQTSGESSHVYREVGYTYIEGEFLRVQRESSSRRHKAKYWEPLVW